MWTLQRSSVSSSLHKACCSRYRGTHVVYGRHSPCSLIPLYPRLYLIRHSISLLHHTKKQIDHLSRYSSLRKPRMQHTLPNTTKPCFTTHQLPPNSSIVSRRVQIPTPSHAKAAFPIPMGGDYHTIAALYLNANLIQSHPHPTRTSSFASASAHTPLALLAYLLKVPHNTACLEDPYIDDEAAWSHGVSALMVLRNWEVGVSILVPSSS